MRDLNTHYVLWKVSLDNGETFYENKGDYKSIPGKPSPWQRLQKYISDNKLEITSLSLYTDKGQTWQLPSAGSNPKFREFSNIEKPIDYDLSRKMARDTIVIRGKKGELKNKGTKVTSWLTVASAIYPDYELQIWVDEFNPRNSWTILKDL